MCIFPNLLVLSYDLFLYPTMRFFPSPRPSNQKFDMRLLFLPSHVMRRSSYSRVDRAGNIG
jgi:hypothetical protein